MAVRLGWTPTGDSATTLDMPSGQLPYLFQGLRNADRAMSITPGGVAVTVVHDVFRAYRFQWRAIRRITDATFWSQLTEFISHCYGGGKFSLALDSAKVFDSTLNGGIAQAAATATTVAAPTSVATGDVIDIQHPTLPDRFGQFTVLSKNDGAKTITFDQNLRRSFPTASIIRHADYFPLCVMLEDESPLEERAGGQGAYLWDLSFTFRTVTA